MEPQPLERHLIVRRTARYYLLGPRPEEARHVWFVLHGYGQLAGRFVTRFRPLTASGALVIAPEALSRYYLDDSSGPHGPDSPVGATWMTREDRETEIADYIAYLDRLRMELLDEPYRLGTTVNILGFSQGCATAARWAVFGGARLSRLVLWAGGLPHDLDLESARPRLAASRLTLVIGRQDEHNDAERVRREEERLQAAGIPYELSWYDGGHRIEDEPLHTLARST